jgi:MFS family permease
MRVSPSRLYIGVLLGGQFVANVDTAIINVATPSIATTLRANGAELQLTVSIYVLATAMLLVTAARLGALYGYRRMFLTGLATFTLASLACGLAPNVASLIVARLVQGVGAALMIAQVMSGIQRTLTGDARTHAIGAYTMTLSLAAVVGQILGGVLITMNLYGLSWRPLFLINVPIGIALFWLALRALPREETHTGPRPALDFGGVALLSLTMLLLVFPLTVGREMGWPPWTIVSLVASIPALTAFGVWQLKLGAAKRGPLLNLSLFREPIVVPGVLAQAFARIPYFTTLFTMALYVQIGLHQTALVSSLMLLGWVAAYGIAGPVYPRLPKHLAAWCGPVGGAVMILGFACTAISTATHAGAGWALAIFLGIGGFGFGILSTAITSQITNAIPKERAPDLSGVLSTMVPLSTTIAIATFGSVYLALASAGGEDAYVRAFTIVNVMLAVSVTIATLLAIVTMRRSTRAAA